MATEKSFDAISEADLMALISLTGEDARAIEFKAELPGDGGAAKHDFLAEVSSFANTRGGHILYGATPRAGLSPAITGLEKNDVEIAIGKMEQLAWKGISPRIPGLQVKAIVLDNHKCVLLVRIPQTWAGPHMVTQQHANNFYSRNTIGKYLLAVDELRAAFCVGESLRDKVRAFRMERMSSILNGGLSVQLAPDAPKIVLHILPAISFRSNFRLELDQTILDHAQEARPMQSRGLVNHYNYDGLITFSSMEKYAYSYVQLFRNGCVEAGESLLLQPKDGRKFIPSVIFEREIIQCGERMLAFLKRLRINPPYAVMLSFLGVRGYSMMVSSMRWQSTSHHVERDNLYMDEIIMEDGTQDFAKAMRPVFNQVWNSCGWAKSMNYDDDGNWREHVR